MSAICSKNYFKNELLRNLYELFRLDYFKFNKFNRLVGGAIYCSGDYFEYTDEEKFKEASFKPSKPDLYYGSYSLEHSKKLNLNKIFAVGSRPIQLDNAWKGISLDPRDGRSFSISSKLRRLLSENNTESLLKYRDSKSTKPVIAQNAVQKIAGDKYIQNVESRSFEAFLQSPELFKINAASFNRVMRKFGAVWTDNLKRSARSVTPLKISDTTSLETIFNFRRGKLNKVTMMIYNKGDQNRIFKSNFMTMQRQTIAAVQQFTGSKLNYKPNAGIAKNNLYWSVTRNHLTKLESNFSDTRNGFSAEYLRLSFSPPVRGLNAVNIDKISSDILTNQELVSMITREKDGSVYLSGVPMVDQGQKGYCAFAATARILNYYGKDIDQHEIAKIALSDNMGTDPDDLKKALQQISSKLRLHFQTLVKCFLGNDNDRKRFMVKLERAFDKEDMLFRNGSLKEDDLKKVFSKMAERESRYKDFKKSIINSINSGRPLAWALQLGIVPEPEIPQASGGHMRLIIGYNETTEQVYYSDSWGAGHEKKAMHMPSAFWVSAALWELRPR